MNDIGKIISQLEQQRDSIDRAISALQAVTGDHAGSESKSSASQARPRKRRLSAAGRKRIAEAAKRRWAAIKAAKAGPTAKAASKAVKHRAKRRISAAGRKRIAEAARKMWARRKAAAKTASA